MNEGETRMLDNRTQKALQEVLHQIQQGKVALFLGAGASHPAGGPTEKKLTEMTKEKFSNTNQALNDFIEVEKEQ
jgi:hypothetical protein